MDWIQFGDVMVNIEAARRIRFVPEATNSQPAPTVIVEFDEHDSLVIHGDHAAMVWYLCEARKTNTRRMPNFNSEEGRLLNAKFAEIRASFRSPEIDKALSIFDFTSKVSASS